MTIHYFSVKSNLIIFGLIIANSKNENEKMKNLILIILIGTLLGACASSKKYLQRGNYDAAIKLAVKKLRKKPTKEKEILILEKAYTKANNKNNERLDFIKLEGNPNIWDEVYQIYNSMKIRQSLVNEVLPLQIISTGRMVQFPRVNYDEEIINAKKKAAEYFYTHANQLLAKGDRDNAKRAYLEFKKVKAFYSDYMDVDEKLKESKYLATLKVIAEPIPMHSQTFSLSNEFFDNKINEFLANMPSSEFVRFYTVNEAKTVGLENPSHVLKIRFDDFVVGQLIMKEKETQESKDNVIMGVRDGNQIKTGTEKIKICHKALNKADATMTISVRDWGNHSSHSDYLGPCGTTPTSSMEVMYGTAKATLKLTTKTLVSKGLLDFKIIDFQSDKVLTQSKFPGEFAWTNQYGSYNGDIRALSSNQQKAVKANELPPPPPQDLFIEFTKPIYDQLTNKVRTFYKNY